MGAMSLEVNEELRQRVREIAGNGSSLLQPYAVELLRPIPRQVSHVIPTDTVSQIGCVQPIRPFRLANAGENTINRRLRDVYPEWAWC
jgi:hypothetical protein